jgi:hypothetical protein
MNTSGFSNGKQRRTRSLRKALREKSMDGVHVAGSRMMLEPPEKQIIKIDRDEINDPS